MKTPVCVVCLSVVVLAGGFVAPPVSAAVIQVDPSVLSGTASVDFEDLGLGPGAVPTFDAPFDLDLPSSLNDSRGRPSRRRATSTSSPDPQSGPLTVVAGAANQNVTAVDGGAGDVGNTAIAGSGPDGFPSAAAIGEGSIAILFDFDQSEFGFDIVGGNGGTATAQFWARDGSLLDQIVFNLTNSVFDSYAFRSDDGSKVIAGVSVFNDDPGGIGFDNFISDVPGVPGDPGSRTVEPRAPRNRCSARLETRSAARLTGVTSGPPPPSWRGSPFPSTRHSGFRLFSSRR